MRDPRVIAVPVDDEVGDQPAHSGRDLEPVPAEAGRDDETVERVVEITGFQSGVTS